MRPNISWPSLVFVVSIGACMGPHDVAGDVFVTIEAGTDVILQGEGIALKARAWHRTPEGGAEEVGGVSYAWRPKDEGIVTVVDSGSRATVIGVSRGTDSVFAIPVDYEDAAAGAIQVRVTAPVEIDRGTPSTVRYGEEVTVTGIGLGHASRFSLGDASLIPEPGSFSGDSAGQGSLRLWVPFPAVSDHLVSLGGEGTSTAAPAQTTVDPRDIFEPDDVVPATVLLAPPGSGGDTLFHNPALALEQDGAIDRYRLRAADFAQPLTVVIASGSSAPASFEAGLAPMEGGWSLGIRTQQCRRDTISVGPAAPDTVARALTGLPAGGVELAVRGSPGRYSLTVLDGYRRQDPAVGPDQFEKNDNCVDADDPAKRIDLSFPFADTLTIDNGYELDWLRFVVPGETPLLLTARTRALPSGAADRSDLALMLFPAPEIGTAPLMSSDAPGSAEELSAELAPGDYYLLVSDRGGVATRYHLCIVLGTVCP